MWPLLSCPSKEGRGRERGRGEEEREGGSEGRKTGKGRGREGGREGKRVYMRKGDRERRLCEKQLSML